MAEWGWELRRERHHFFSYAENWEERRESVRSRGVKSEDYLEFGLRHQAWVKEIDIRQDKKER
jgi:hypothetical protein